MNMNYLSRLYQNCTDDKLMYLNEKLSDEDFEIIETWNENPLFTHYDIARALKKSDYETRQRILRINRLTKTFINKNFNFEEKKRVHFFRECLMCGDFFVAQSSNKLCSEECRDDRTKHYKKKHSEKNEIQREENRRRTHSLVFNAKEPVHNDWLPVHLMLLPVHIKMNLKAYIRRYNLENIIDDNTFQRKDGHKTKKRVVYVSLKGIYDLLKIKHENYRLSNNAGLKDSYEYWLDVYNQLNVKGK